MTVAFLASDDAGFITGVTVPVDGGSSRPVTGGAAATRIAAGMARWNLVASRRSQDRCSETGASRDEPDSVTGAGRRAGGWS